MTKTLPTFASLFLLAACGAGPLPAVVWDNSSLRPTSNAEDVWATTEGVLGEAIDLSGFTVHIHAHIGDGCPPGVAECTNPEAYSLSVAFAAAPDGVAENLWDEALAGLMCHELMHVHCYQTTGDAYCGVGEADHDHKAPFDYGRPTSTCYTVADLFSDGFESE